MASTHPSEKGCYDDAPSGSEAVAKLRLQLRHVPLSRLEAAGVVRWDEDDRVVTKGPEFDEEPVDWRVDR